MLTYEILKLYEHELDTLCRSFFQPFSERFECILLESSLNKENTINISLGIGTNSNLIIHAFSLEDITSQFPNFKINYGTKDSILYSVPVLQWIYYVQEKANARERSIQFMRIIKEELIAKVWHPSRVERLIEMRGLDILVE